MTFTQQDWLCILDALRVRPTTATEWSSVFADEVQPEKFSRGMDDLTAFVPQILYEYSLLEKTEESLIYSPERLKVVWPSRFPTVASAIPYAYAPVKLANFVYASRMGNGDEASGDGYNYRGRPMLTGRGTYQRIGDHLGQDLVGIPGLIQQPHYGIEAMRCWWETTVPDLYLSDQVKIRRIVQGGGEGLDYCMALHTKLLEVLACRSSTDSSEAS